MHVMGMFVPSFFTGNLINRFGLVTVMMLGIVMFLAGILAGLSGLSEWHFRIALTLNGIGWNFLFVGATTMVIRTYRPNERGKVQALNDFLVFGFDSLFRRLPTGEARLGAGPNCRVIIEETGASAISVEISQTIDLVLLKDADG